MFLIKTTFSPRYLSFRRACGTVSWLSSITQEYLWKEAIHGYYFVKGSNNLVPFLHTTPQPKPGRGLVRVRPRGHTYTSSAPFTSCAFRHCKDNPIPRHHQTIRNKNAKFPIHNHTAKSTNRERDICDLLEGDYPKDFVFEGWHPQCFCIATPILPTPEELIASEQDGDALKGKLIDKYPAGFQKWCNDNADKIAAAEREGKLPYFVKHNREAATVAGRMWEDKLGQKALAATPAKRTAQQIGEARHKARTPEQIDAIVARARQRDTRQLIAEMQANPRGLIDNAPQLYIDKWERISIEQRLEVLRQGKFTGYVCRDQIEAGELSLYAPTSKDAMVGVVQDMLDNVKHGYNVEDENHYYVILKSGKAIDTAELAKPLTKKQIESAVLITANEGLSNYRYWAKDAAAFDKLNKLSEAAEFRGGLLLNRNAANWATRPAGKYYSDNGGKVTTHEHRVANAMKNKNELSKFNKEFGMCKILADNGCNVGMLKEIPGTSSPDILVNGKRADLKKTTGTSKNIEKYGRKAVREQGAEIVVFEFDEINENVINSVKMLSNENIHGIFYETNNGKLHTF